VAPDDPAARYVSNREEKIDKNSSSALNQIQKWISNCEKAHGHHNSTQCGSVRDTYLPDRCISVLPGGVVQSTSEGLSTVPRLVETRGEKGKYLALSYCWGEEHYNPLRTTESNYKEHLVGIPSQALALTIRQAIQITQQLGIRYLWVDALCIIQDSPSDKDAQIGQMRSIFENSFLTILAASAANASQGIFTMPHPISSQIQIPYLCPDGVIGRIWCLKREQLGMKDQPINRRAWTLEERLLSSRKVIYLSDRLAWECDSISLADSGEISNMHDEDLRLSNYIRNPRPIVSPVSGWLEWGVHTEWVKNVAWYTQRDLTKPGDKLRAIGGIADKYHAILRDRYLAGLWRSHISAGLLWRRSVSRTRDTLFPRPLKYRAPSWSWASIDGEVEYDWPERKDGSLECARIGHKDSIAKLLEIQVTEAEVELTRPDKPFGAVEYGFIKATGMMSFVKGNLKPANHEEKGEFLEFHVQRGFYDTKILHAIDCWPDSDETLPLTDNGLWLLGLTGAAEDLYSDNRLDGTLFLIRGLLLVPVVEAYFRRIGFFVFKSSSYEVLMSGFKKRIITLL